MKKEIIGNCTLYNAKMEHTIHQIHGVDHILTDPPYLYIKTHDFDKKFNEKHFFECAKEMLPDNGFIALFGRGTSFYRWNTRLADLGFVFKEEIVWDKRFTTAPCIALSRVHETISIHTKKTGKTRYVKLPYKEQKQYDFESILNDVNRIKVALKNENELNELISLIKNKNHYNFTTSHGGSAISVQVGLAKEKSRAKQTLRSILSGMREKSIIVLQRNHYKLSHPTEKPVRLAERILALISDPGDTIYDPFMGSGSFGVACINTGRKYIGSEMKPEYFEIACKRIEEAHNQPILAEVSNG
jgi:site-specific DNA-methyltransferase (adenine-specific)